MELNQSNSKNTGLKTAVIALAVLLLGSIAYIFKMNSDNNTLTTEKNAVISEKDKLKSDLESKIAEYEKAIGDNTALKGELEAEQAKMVELLDQLKKSKGDAASMSKFKSMYLKLKSDMDALVAENNSLKEKNVKLTKDLDSTNVVLTDTRKVNDTLRAHSDNLSKTVERGQKLSITNLQTLAVKQRSSGKQIDTDKASRADVLKISFTIASNEIAKSGDRTYYIQVIDSKNNVLGEKKAEVYGEKMLPYSFTKKVKYENKTVQVQEDLAVKNITGGTYFVNVFDDKGNKLTDSTFNLR